MAAARVQGLPLPKGGVLWSPWVDLTDSYSGSWTVHAPFSFSHDLLCFELVPWIFSLMGRLDLK